MILVGPSLGAAVAIDFAVHYPEAVSIPPVVSASYHDSTSMFYCHSKIWLLMLWFVCHWQVKKLVLINASVYAKGTGNLAKLPKLVAYAGVGVRIP